MAVQPQMSGLDARPHLFRAHAMHDAEVHLLSLPWLLGFSRVSCKSQLVNSFTSLQDEFNDDDRVFTRASQILKACKGKEYSERGWQSVAGATIVGRTRTLLVPTPVFGTAPE